MPAEPFAVSIATPLAAAAVVDAVDDADVVAAGAAAAVALVELLELPHPAMIKAAVASAATPPMRNFAVLRLAMVCSQVVWFSVDRQVDGYL
ncbi:MAG TPA: hypothetical protein VMA96_12750 [Solirubrobacteraceae bacterium]|nr:hypothetical protein [Solirubrobacteraceae bacterium]